MATSRNITTEPTEQAEPTTPVNPISELAQALVTAMRDSNSELANAIIQAQQASAPPRQLTVDEVMREPALAARAERTRRVRHGGKRFIDNDQPLNSGALLSDEEVDLLHQLRPGVFINGLVTVIETAPNGVTGDRTIRLVYATATPDQRIALKNEVRNFAELLRRCVDEANTKSVVAAP